MSETEHRNPDGTFKEGHQFATGRTKGTRNKLTVLSEKIIAEDGDKLMRLIMDQALEGHWESQKFIGERIIPPKKSRELAVGLPDIKTGKDIWEGIITAIAAMAQGEITPDEAKDIKEMLESALKHLPLSF